MGYARTENFASPEGHGGSRDYTVPALLARNQWGLAGTWTVGAESAALDAAPGSIAFRFHSRDLHLVLLPAANGAPVRYRVTLDGSAPGHDHGLDVADDGIGTVREPRLYQLVRQTGSVRDRTFRIEFLDTGVRAFVFTFG